MWQFVLLTLFLQPGAEKPPAERIIYDVQIVEGERLITAQLALYRFEGGTYSLHCRKKPSGTIFHYWANGAENVLYLPRMKTAYLGHAEDRFQLFEAGPRLASEEWLKLLDGEGDLELGSWRLHGDPLWQSLYRQDPATRIMWRERKRKTTSRYSNKIKEPFLAEGTERLPLDNLSSSVARD